jgi:hypothetical protein
MAGLCRRDSERPLIVQNTPRGNVGGVELCQRQHRQCRIMSEVLYILQNHPGGDLNYTRGDIDSVELYQR